MCGIKIPQQDFVLKMQGGGLCTRGGVFVGHYGTCIRCTVLPQEQCPFLSKHSPPLLPPILGPLCTCNCMTTRDESFFPSYYAFMQFSRNYAGESTHYARMPRQKSSPLEMVHEDYVHYFYCTLLSNQL